MSQIPVDTITVQESPTETCWRLIHNGAKVIALFESSGLTWTKDNLFCATTKQECLDEIARLKIEYLLERFGVD